MQRHGYPVVEIFGPTIQGEGPEAGRPTHFVRFGGCDYRCSWCDSMYAVEPAEVRRAERLGPREIARRLLTLSGARRVVLTGGNPALHHLGDLMGVLGSLGYHVAVETQGSVWRPWLDAADSLVISPKPPSSGMENPQLHRFLNSARRAIDNHRAFLKIVVFDDADFDWMMHLREIVPQMPLYLSAGTPVGLGEAETLAAVTARYAWLAERVAADRRLHAVTVLPQLHVVAWGTRRGV